MKEPFEINGYWWLPETPETKVPGSLSYSPGEYLKLNLMGALNKILESDFPPPDFIEPEIIYGYTSKGKSVTLYKCIQLESNPTFGEAGSFLSTQFIAHCAFFGSYFPSYKDIQFSSVSVQFHNLNSWFNEKCIIYENSYSDPKISFKKPQPLSITVKDGFDIQFSVFAKPSITLNNASITMNPVFEITNQTQKHFEDYLGIIKLIQYFLTLAMNEPTFVININGNLSDRNEPDRTNIFYSNPIKIFYGDIGWQSQASKLHWADMLLPFHTIQEFFPAILKTWIEESESIKPVYDLYFARIFRSAYSDNEFLNLTQAIETYHRRTYGGKYQSDDIYLNSVYKSLLSAIPKDIDIDFKSSLMNGKLRFANEFSLRKRILLLTEHISKNISVNFLNEPKLRLKFAELIANTRNYLTHYSPELKDKAIGNGKDFFEVNRQLELILQICFMEKMGIPFDKIAEILKKLNSTSKYFG